MLRFMETFRDHASVVFDGFGRIVFRGILRGLMHPDGMRRPLSRGDVPRRLFGAHVEQTILALRAPDRPEAGTLPMK